MGWWEVVQDDQKLIQGDEPLDQLGEALEAIANIYQNEWQRKPTLAEILRLTEGVIAGNPSSYLSDGNSIKQISLSAKLEEHSFTSRYNVGDFFRIPIDNHYAYGRVLGNNGRGEVSMLIGIYDEFINDNIDLEILKNGPFLFHPFYCIDEGLVTGRWEIIGNIAVEPTEFEHLKFKMGNSILGWHIIHGENKYAANEEDVRGIEQYKYWNDVTVEGRIKTYIQDNKVAWQ